MPATKPRDARPRPSTGRRSSPIRCLVAALINLGNLHYIEGHLPEALALYAQAASQAPDYFEAHYNLANALHDAGRFEEAAEAYQASLAVDETHAEAHFYLAVTFEKLGNSTRGASALAGIPDACAQRRMGGAGEGVYREHVKCGVEVPEVLKC